MARGSIPAARAGRRRVLLLGAAVAALVVAAIAAIGPRLPMARHLRAAREALGRGDMLAALRSLETADRLRPGRAEVQYLLAVAKRRAGRIDESAVHLQRAQDLGWPSADVQRQRWLATAQGGDVPAVKRELMEAIERGVPDDVAEEIYEAVAKGHMAAYRLRDAWMCLDVWLQWRPDAPHARMMRASIFEQTGDLDQAVDDYRAVLETWPEHRDAQIRLGQVLLRKRAYDEARDVFHARVDVAPEDAEALLGLAQSERWLGNDAEAKRLAEAAMALGLSPRHQGLALEELGRALLKEGKHEEAIAALTQATALAPGEGLIHHALGMALARAGRTEEALAHQERLRRIQAEYDRMTQITRNLMDRPLSAELRCEAGSILTEQGLKKEGADWLLTALCCDPSHRKSHQLLAEYYAEAGNQSQAAHHRLMAAQAPQRQPPAKPK